VKPQHRLHITQKLTELQKIHKKWRTH